MPKTTTVGRFTEGVFGNQQIIKGSTNSMFGPPPLNVGLVELAILPT